MDLQPLSSLPDEVTLDQLNATVTIIDNDGAVIGFRPEVYEVDEDAGSVILTVEVISGELIEDVTLIYMTADGSAVAGEDYTSKNSMLTLSAGDTSATIVVDITDDSTEEPDEMFTVELSPGSSGVTLDPSVATVTINENDQPPVVIGFRSEEYEVEEGAGSVILTVEVISGVLTEEVTLSYTTADGIATSPGDYTGANGVPIPALSAMTRSVTFRVEIVDDMDPESAESFFVDLELLPLPDRVTLNPSFATVTIPENDQPIVGFDSATYRVAENAGTVVLTVKLLSGILTAPVTVSYGTMDGSARTGSDYTTMISTLTLSPGDTEETIMVPIIDDSTEEPDEMFTVELSGAPAGITLDPSVATVTIDENDQPPVVIGFDSGTYRVNENAGTLDLTVSVISGVLTETIRLNYLVSDVSTTASDDYTVTVNVLELSLMNPSVMISVDIINDTLLEFEEKFTVELSGAPAGITLAPASATVAIVDTEVTLDSYGGEEWGETAGSKRRGSFLEFELTNAPGGAPVPLVLGLAARAATINDGGTAADVIFVEVGTDGTAVEITSVTIDAGETSPSGLFGFVTVDDDVVELTETVNLYIATINGIPITDNGRDLTIFSNDRVRTPILTVEDGREGDTITATIDLGGKTLSDAIPHGALRLVLADGSTMNADVEIVATDVVLGLQKTSAVKVPIRLKDDDLFEGPETVDLELRIDSTIAPGLEDLLNLGRTGSFMLADADSGEVSIAALSKTTYNEGEDVTVTVELPNGLTAVTDITVGYELIVTTTDEVGKASAADITGPTSGFVTIDEGAGTAIITINLKDDDVVEATEQLGVRLTSLSGVPAGITLDPATATVTIVDNDETPVPEIGFEFGTYRVNEDAGTLDIMVSVINGVLTETIRLNYVVSDVSTTVSDDYTVTVDVLELPLMTHGGTISIDIIDDTSPESEEKFTVQLSGAPVGVSLNTTGATVTIIDNDQPAVGFRSANYEANEGAGGVTVTFGIYNNIVLPPNVTLTVEYATRDGSARSADGDYSVATGSRTFSAGMTETTIYVDITDDSEFEADETFLVRLIRVEANIDYDIILSPQPQTTVTLNNNDLPDVTLDYPYGDLAWHETAGSNQGGSFLEVELTNASGGAPVPLVLGLAARAATINDGGTAADVIFVEIGTDGTFEKITSVTIDAGETSPSGFFGFVTVDDDVVELTETVNLYIATINGIPITDNGLDLTIFGNDRVRTPILTVEDGREGDTITATINLGGKTLSDAIPPGALRLVLADGSTMNADVEIGATDVVLGLQKTAAVNVPIRLKDDDLFEGPETVDLELRIDSTIAPGLEDLLDFGRTGSFMLADADSGEVSIAALSKTTYNEGEDVTVTVELPNGLTAVTDITVGYELIVTTTDEVGKASAADIDGGLITGTVTINEGAGTAIITISLANDDVVEVTERLGVRLISAKGAPGVTVDTTITRLTIIGKDETTVPPVVDPDTVVIGFRPATYKVDEGAGSVTLTVEVISGVLTEEVTLTHMTAAGSATAPGDYTGANGVSIPALSAMTQSVTLRVAIIDDDEIDPDEMFTVELSGAPVGVSFNPTRATVTIIDNDETTVPPVVDPDPVMATLSPDNITVLEGMDMTFEIRLTANAPEDLTFMLVGDSAHTGDYTLSPDPIVIMEGDDHVTVTIRAVDDPAAELVEVFMLSLMSDSSLVMVGDPSSITVTIPVNDQPVIPPDPEPDPVKIGFSSATYTVDESAGSVMLTVEVISGTLTEDVILTYTTPAGTATAGEDYTSMFGILTLSPGDTEKTIVVPIVNDDLFENDEMFTVFLTTFAGVTLTPDTAEVTITDTNAPDAVEIGFDPVMYTVDEDAGTIALTVKVLSGDLGRAVTLSYETRDGTATAGEDYTSKATTLTLSAGDTETTIVVNITDDDLFENAEMFTVVLSGAPAGVTLTPDTAEITISDDRVAPPPDDDMVEIGFDPVMYTVGEDAGTIALTVKVLSGDLGRAVTLSYETRDGTATAGEDYTSKATTLTLSAGDTETTIVVNITDDDLFENAEMFTVVLSGAPAGVTLTPDTAEITISDDRVAPPPDDDMVEIGFDPVMYTVDEGAGTIALTVKVLSGDLGRAVTLSYETRDGTATAGEDYTSKATTLTLSAGDTETTIVVNITDDDLFENEEMFTVVLSGAPAGVTLTPDTAEVTITDTNAPDLVEIGFDPVMYTVDEGSGTITLTVKVLSGDLGRDVTVSYETMDGSAIAGEDYTRTIDTIMLSDTIRNATFTVPIIDDGLFENDELFTVVLSGAPAGITLDPATATVTITDDDGMPTVTVTPASPTVAEGEDALFTVTLTGEAEADIVVTLTATPGSGLAAAEDGDFSATPVSVTFSTGEVSRTLRLPTTEDEVYEDNEEVALSFSISGPAIEGSVPSTLTIENDDGMPTVTVTPASPTVAEGEEALFTVTLTGEAEADIVVTLTATPGSGSAAAEDGDFSPTPVSVTFSTGEDSRTLRLPTTEDDVYEDNEEVALSFSISGPASEGSVPSTLTIENDDTIIIGFDPEMYTVDEGSGTVTLTVKVLSGDLGRDVTLNYETMDGSTVAGEDYTTVQSTLTLTPVNTEKVIVVNITDDGLFENDELFTVVLREAPAGVTLNPASAEVTITDNEPAPDAEIGFDSGTYRVNEASGTVALTVSVISGVLVDTVTLTYATVGDSATSGADYELSTGTVELSSRMRTATIEIVMLDDSVVESAEIFFVDLERVSVPNSVSLIQFRAAVTIIDNDVVEIGFDPVMYTVNEGAGTIELTVKVLSGGLGRDVTLNYRTDDDTATAGEDYMSKDSMLTLSAGDTSATIVVDITDDALFENAEIFTVVLSGAPAGVTLIPSTATITITDTNTPDVVEIGFDPDTYTVDEGAGTITLTVKVLSGDLGRDVTVSYETMDGSAIAGEDYTTVQSTLTLTPVDTEMTIVVNITDDALFENAEMFTVVLSGAPAGVTLTPATATITITDTNAPDVVVIGFDPDTYTVDEGSGTIELTVKVLSGDLGRDVTVSYETIDGSAIAGEDYTTMQSTLTLSPMTPSVTFTVPIIDNITHGSDQMFTVKLSGTSADITLEPTTATVTITDDDSMPTVTITPASPSVEEGEDAVFTVTLNGEAEEDIVVTLTPSPGSGSAAAEVGDYSAGSVSVTFSTGDGPQTLRLQTTADVVYEVTETVSLGFSISGPATIASAPSTLTITNDDSMPTVTVTPASPSVEEGEGAVFTVTLNGEAEEDIVVTLTPSPGSGSAAAEVGDYSAGSVSVTFSTGDGPQTLRLQTTADVVYEVTETVSLGFSISGPATIASAPSTLTITNDDSMPTVTVTPASPSVEEGEAATFTVTLNGEAEEDIVVTLTPSPGSGSAAAEVGDYSAGSVSVTFSTGDGPQTLRLQTTEDMVYEVTETVSLGFSISGPATIASAPSTLTITNDDSMPTVTITPASPTVAEGEDATFTVTLTGEAEADIVVTLTATPGSGLAAAEDEDFSATPVSVTFSTGESSQTLRLPTTEDEVYEDNEEVALSFSISGPAIEGSVPSTLTIENDDGMPTVTVTPASPTVAEGEEALFTVTLTGEAEADIEITLTATPGSSSAAAEDGDFSTTPVSVTFSTGENSRTLRLPTTEDEVYESDEEVALSFSISGPASEGGVPSILTIEDDDTVIIGFDPVMYTVDEDSGTVALTVKVLNGDLGRDVTLSYETMDGSAVAGEDYTSKLDMLTLSAGDTSATIVVDITDDALYENAELFTVVLSGAPSRVTLNPDSAEVTITDDEPAPAAVIGFEQIEYLVSEEVSRTVLTVSVISGVLHDTATLTYATVDGSATSGADYELSTGTITLSPSDGTATIEIVVLDDSVVESAEIFFVDLRRASVTNTVLLTPFRASVTIEDNEVAIGFDSRTYRVGEASGTVELTVSVINGVLTETITLNYKTMDGSAIAGEDYTSTMSTVTLSPMTPSVTFTVPITDDDTDEPDQMFTVVLSGAPADITLDPATATVTIIDNDAVVIGFDARTYRVNEDAGTLELTVSVINGVLTETITLNFAVSDVSTTISDDYTVTVDVLELSLMTSSVTISVDIINDPTQEPDEEFTVELSDAPAGITLDPAIATVTIPANDQPSTGGPGPSGPGPSGPGPSGPGPSGPGPSGPTGGNGGGGDPDPEPEPEPLTVSLGPAEQTVNEGDQIVVTVTLSEVSEDDITVTLTASGGTADTDDHGLTMQETLTIAAGDETAMFTISTTDDDIYEGDETLVLSLSSSAEVERNADESEITISDNDPIPTLSLEMDNLSVREGSSVTIRARLSNVSGEAILVALILEGQTALLGSDFPPPVEFSTEIAPGSEFAEFIINTIDDSVYEQDETVLLQLVVVEGNVTEGTLAGTLSITDDDPMPALSIDAPDEIIEGTTELVTIRLNGMNVDPVTVRVSAGSGGDVSEDEYTLSPAEVTIEPGQLEATVMLSVVDDGLIEISEILVLEVAADGYATVQHRVTIPGSATALVLVDDASEAESCDQSGGTCVEVEPDAYSEPLLLFVEEVTEPTGEIPPPINFTYLPNTPLWDIEFLLESDPDQVVSELDGRVRINLSAPRDLVDANGGTAMISIATLHKGSTEWELLETTYDQAASDDNTYHFYAYTTRFSYFTLVMLDEVEIIEPPVEPVDPPPSSGLPITLLLGIGIGLAVLVVIVIIVVVVLRRKKS